LGQNFARAFDVSFQDESNSQQLVWATSWGVSTRLVGALIMSHSDDAGLVLPPKVAPIQAVVVPISQGPDKKPDEHEAVMRFVDQAVEAMRAAGVRVHVDTRFNLRPGPKFFEWERKGIPLRLEVGPRDVAQGKLVAARRTGGDKFDLSVGEGLGAAVAAELSAMQAALLAAAEARLRQGTREASIHT
jgi:prolyl-tRNA synthetase